MEGKETASDRIQNRNIVDMLRDDQSAAAGSKKNWKAFRDRLRLKRAGKAWTSSVPIPASDLPINTNTNRMMIRRGSSRYPTDPNVDELDGEATRQLGYMPDRQRSGRLLPVETDPEEEDGDNPPDDGENKPDQQMSLMSLLSDHGSHYNAGPDEHVEEHHEEVEPEEEEEKKEKEEDIGDYNICGGCRGKHKNAAFGPCGHTFCRNCTKELHISIGNCPTCSNYMLEILDIY